MDIDISNTSQENTFLNEIEADMKKILIATDAWSPLVNGLTKTLEGFITEFQKQDFEVLLLEPTQFTHVPMLFWPEIKMAIFPYTKIRESIQQFRPDHIIIATTGPIGWATRRVCMDLNVPFTSFFMTNIDEYVAVRTPWYAAFLRTFLKKITLALHYHFHKSATSIVVPSQSLKEKLETNGFTGVHTVPLASTILEPQKNMPDAYAHLPRPIFLYLGRLVREKNLPGFLELDLPGTKLVIGDGRDRNRLEKKYGDKAVFVGMKLGQELSNIVSFSDVLVFPSKTDTFGISIVDALTCGVPVAAHNVMGPRDILTHGTDGYLGDDLREAALACLSLSSEDCKTTAKRYTWDTATKELLHALAQVPVSQLSPRTIGQEDRPGILLR